MDAVYGAAYRRLYEGHWWWRAREHYLLRRIEHAGLPTPARILDVGCGDGLFFTALAQFGVVAGIEADRALVSQEHEDAITVGELDDSYRPDEPFDLILLLDVVEHADEPLAMLERARALLAPGGRVLMTVPAFKALWTSHDELNRHRTRYSKAVLRELVQAAGLTVDDARYLFCWPAVGKLVQRASERILERTPRAPRIPPEPLNRILEQVCLFEQRFVRRPPFGSSLVVVAHTAR